LYKELSLNEQKDRERAVYGLKEKNLAKAYIKLIPLGNKDPDALRLLQWKKPSNSAKQVCNLWPVLDPHALIIAMCT
jgi:hypothetical protein